jgi:hypothetical protein
MKIGDGAVQERLLLVRTGARPVFGPHQFKEANERSVVFWRDLDDPRPDASTLCMGDQQHAVNHGVIDQLHFERRGFPDGKTHPCRNLQALLCEFADLADHGFLLPLKEALAADGDPGLFTMAVHAEQAVL